MAHPAPRLTWALLAGAWIYVGSILAGGPQHPAEHAAPAPAPATPGSSVTVVFWNVQWFPGRKKEGASPAARAAHLAAVVPALERLNPDLLGLEEVADLPAAQSLADHLKGFKVDICSQFPLPDSPAIGRQQMVLCSRLPVLQAWAEPWKAGANGVLPRRGFVVAAYQTAPGQVLIAYGTHLKSNRVDTPGGEPDNAAMRQESARQLIAHSKGMIAAYRALGAVSVLIGGDMNTSLDDPAFSAETTLPDFLKAGFQWGWKGTPLEMRYTFPGEGRYPAACFDHLFLQSAASTFAAASVGKVGRECSDHRPVTMKIVTPARGPGRL